jgi:hypothetical protein
MVWRDVVNPEDRLAPAEIILSAYIPRRAADDDRQPTVADASSSRLMLD